MKRFLQVIFLLLTTLVTSFDVTAATRTAAEIVSIKGIGEYRPDEDKGWSGAKVDQDLFAGNYVRTGILSRMGLLFSDKTQIRMNEKTVLRVKAVREPDTKAGETILRLDRGRAWTQTKALPRGLIMETPSATAAIRGTDWDLEVDENGTSIITVLSGEVEFYNDFGKVIVARNEQARAEVSKAPVKLVIVRPTDRVQWVTAYAIEPLRHISLYDGGLGKLKAALDKVHGASAEAQAERGSIKADLGRWNEAEASFKAALEADGNNSRALIGLGYVALHRHQPREAEKYFNQVHTSPAEHELLELGRITVNIQDEQFGTAVSRLQALNGRVELYQPAAYLVQSDLMIYSGELQRAISLIETALNKFPNNARAYSQLARIYLISDQAKLSSSQIQYALASDKESYEARIVQGDLARIEGYAKDATSAYKEAMALKSDDDRAWYGLGVVNTEREYVKAARTDLAKALELNPHGPGYQGEQGTLETFVNNFKAAESAFKDALKDNPGDYIALTGLGVMQLKRGETEVALDSLLRAGLMEPRYARARMYTGVAYYQLGKVTQALEELGRASELDDKDPIPYFLASIIYTDMLRPGDAINEARQALKLMPYLKSLNQLVNTQRGTTNLGQAFAFMGMEDWSQMYAQESYNQYWAGSHLFLADRYAGLFTKNSELFQGFLSDPTVFGADNRFQTLLPKPAHNLNMSVRGTTSDNFDGISPFVEVSGFANRIAPFAYYLTYEKFDLDFESEPYDRNIYTIALGSMPVHNFGVFGFADHSNLQTSIDETVSGVTIDVEEELDTDRRDFGINFKLSPTSQFWLKSGHFRSDDHVKGFIGDALFNLPQDVEMDVDVRSPEFAFRHTFNLEDRHEISWGYETAHRKTTWHYDQFDQLDTFLVWGTLARDVVNQSYSEKSRDLYISDRITLNPNLLVQPDLFYQLHNRKVHEDFDWRFPLFPGIITQQFPDVDDQHKHDHMSPRLGFIYKWDSNKLVRFAYQNWIRPSSQGSLGPVATAGIPLDDRLVSRGGELKRYRGQFEWELSPKTFSSVFFDYKKIDNNLFAVTTPFVINELESLNKLHTRDLGSLTREDLLEFVNTPEYEGGKIKTTGLSVNHLLIRRWGIFGKYIYTSSENIGDTFNGNDVPFLPEHTAAMGATWSNPNGWYFVSRLVYRTDRYTDEGNANKLKSSWDGAVDIYWQSKKKDWLFRFSVDDAFDKNQDAQYTAEINFRY